jgi:glycosyltransferase involved in cell wall biosynthesis
MKILQVVPSLLPERGGPSRTLPELCRALAALRMETTLLATHESRGALTIDPQKEPYEVLFCEGSERSLSTAREVYATVKNRAREYDVVHIHSVWNLIASAASAAARHANLPYVIAPMGMLSRMCLRQSHLIAKRFYAVAYERRTIEGAARLHLASRGESESLIDGWFQYPKYFIARNGTTIPTSLQPGAFRRQFPELKNRRIMLFFGRLHPIKGLDLQLDTLALLKPKYPDLVWVLVGPDDGEWNRLKSAIHARGLDESVRWVGPMMGEDRFSALLDCQVLIHTSHYENQAMTINEALGVGTPLVITDSVNYPEVELAGAGYVVVRPDSAALAAKIGSILDDPQMAEKMRETGRRFAAAELAWSGVAKTVLRAYAEVLTEHQRASIIRHANPLADAARTS